MREQAFFSESACEPVGKFPHALRVGNLLFISGVGPRLKGHQQIPGVELDASGKQIGHDIEVQCHSVFKNVQHILEDSGLTWSNLVDVTVFLTHMKQDFATFNRIWAQYFKRGGPCRTTLEILSLPTPIAIELKCIAAFSKK